MNTTQNKIVFASVLTVSLAMISIMVQPQIFAEETEEPQFIKAGGIEIHTVFHFHDAIEESDSFQVFDQMSGFDRATESASFKLEGIMSFDRANLYKATDMTYHKGLNDARHDYGQFDVDVYIHIDGTTLRHLQYADCSISDYQVNTRVDKEEGWTTSKGFATIDVFEFECNGYQPVNPLYDLTHTNGYQADNESSLDLRDTQTWSDLYR